MFELRNELFVFNVDCHSFVDNKEEVYGPLCSPELNLYQKKIKFCNLLFEHHGWLKREGLRFLAIIFNNLPCKEAYVVVLVTTCTC